MVGVTPWYITFLQYADVIIGIFYPIALVTILFLAFKEFKKLVSCMTDCCCDDFVELINDDPAPNKEED